MGVITGILENGNPINIGSGRILKAPADLWHIVTVTGREVFLPGTAVVMVDPDPPPPAPEPAETTEKAEGPRVPGKAGPYVGAAHQCPQDALEEPSESPFDLSALDHPAEEQ